MSDKQKEKIINDLRNNYDKLNASLTNLKDDIIKLEDGEDKKVPYWNGDAAYNIYKRLHTLVDNGFILSEYIKECEESIKK